MAPPFIYDPYERPDVEIPQFQIPGADVQGYLSDMAANIGSATEGVTAQRESILQQQRDSLDYAPSTSAMAGSMLLPALTGLALGGREGASAGLGGALFAGNATYNNLQADELKRQKFLDREVDRADKDLDYLRGEGTRLQGMKWDLLNAYGKGAFPGTPPAAALMEQERQLYQDKINYQYEQSPENQPVPDSIMLQLKAESPDLAAHWEQEGRKPTLRELKEARGWSRVAQEGQRIEISQERHQMNMDALRVFGYTPGPGARVSTVGTEKASQRAQLIEVENAMAKDILGFLRQGGNRLTGDVVPAMKNRLNELYAARKDRYGAGAALTPTEVTFYFMGIEALLNDPTKSWGDVAKTFMLNRDPAVAFQQMVVASKRGMDAYMKGMGWGPSSQGTSPQDKERAELMAELERLKAGQ